MDQIEIPTPSVEDYKIKIQTRSAETEKVYGSDMSSLWELAAELKAERKEALGAKHNGAGAPSSDAPAIVAADNTDARKT